MNKSYSKLRKEIMDWGNLELSTQEQISFFTGVSQSQVSKILSGRFKTISPNVEKICKYANIQIKSKSDMDLPPSLREALMDLWDGSKESERVLIKMLKNMKGLAVNCRAGNYSD